MELERWADPFSAFETWVVNGCLSFTVTRTEVMSLGSREEYEDFLMRKLMPLAFLAMPVHDNPKETNDRNPVPVPDTAGPVALLRQPA